MPAELLTTDGKPGVKVTYLKQDIVSAEIAKENATGAATTLGTRIEPDDRYCGAEDARRRLPRCSRSPCAGKQR